MSRTFWTVRTDGRMVSAHREYEAAQDRAAALYRTRPELRGTLAVRIESDAVGGLSAEELVIVNEMLA